MKTRPISLLLTLLLLPAGLSGQYIIQDKDGYTNIRKEPNARSEIVGQVVKYQIVYDVKDIPCYEGEWIDDYGNWPLISTDIRKPAGYIYKGRLLSLSEMHKLENQTGAETDSLTCYDNRFRVTLLMRPYEEKPLPATPSAGDAYITNINPERRYGTDGWTPYKEIRELSITRNGKTVVLPREKLQNYFDVGWMSVWVGPDDELYILLGGGDGSGGYDAWLSVVDDDIVCNLIVEC